jgi:threonine/homoserine/homoserine lactone efflux protein
MLGRAWIVTALNPKGITFFIAFLPQFIDPGADWWTQMLIFETTFICLAFANALGYAAMASRARGFMRSERALSVCHRIGGTLLIGAGLATATMRSSQ